jgi:hypothetical protein
MRRIVYFVVYLMLFGVVANLYAGTMKAAAGIYASGSTLIIKFKPNATVTGGYTGGSVGIRWLTSLGAGVTVSEASGSFGFSLANGSGGVATSGSYSYAVFAATSAIASATYTSGGEYTLMTCDVSGGVGTGDFELCPSGFAGDNGSWYIEVGGADCTPAAGSWYYASSVSGVVLPVELVSFTASVNHLNADLQWLTATEVNNYGFDIERRTVSSQLSAVSSWAKVGFVNGNGTSNVQHSYSFSENITESGTYAYRLKQIDNSGTFKYSQETQVTIEVPKVFNLNQNYPNPFNPTTNIEFTVAADGKAVLKVYNALGQQVAELYNGTAQAGRIIQTHFDASRLASGIYFSRLESDGKSLVKRMMFIK